MALNPSFSVAQNSGQPNIITITDTSTGVDALVTKRRVRLLQANGKYLVPEGTLTNYIDWPLANAFINLDVLKSDTALQITVEWLNAIDAVLYTVTTAFGFSAFGESFYYNLTQLQQADPNIIAAQTFYQSKMMLRVELDSAAQAISFAGDIQAAQECYNRANNFIVNQSYYF